MNFLLKIVEGPNKGAEIALVEGVAVTLGKLDDCDIVLADTTMPDEPLKIETSADAVMVDGAALEPFVAKTVGATSFAVGPADAPWETLKWPKDGDSKEDGPKTESPKTGDPAEEDSGEETSKVEDSGAESPEKKKHGGCLGCLVALVLLLLVLAGFGWFFRAGIMPHAETMREKIGVWYSSAFSRADASNHKPRDLGPSTLGDIAAKYSLSLDETNGATRISGNLATRRERLAATAEAYEAQPGVELDLSDDESFRTAAEDALFTLTEGALKAAVATNRVLEIVGVSPSASALKRTLEALAADMPKLRDVDVSGVSVGGFAAGSVRQEDAENGGQVVAPLVSRQSAKKSAVSFPVCGILTTPYPCLVMRDGRRIMEGAAIGDGVIVEIGADSVTLTNSTGRFVWKP